MATADRSEEIYAKVASIPLRRRIIYDVLGFVPFFVIVGCLAMTTSRCKGDPADAMMWTSIVGMISSCIGVVVAGMWWSVSHPGLLRYLVTLPNYRRFLLVYFTGLAVLMATKIIFGPFVAGIDARHAAYCEAKSQIREAANADGSRLTWFVQKEGWSSLTRRSS